LKAEAPNVRRPRQRNQARVDRNERFRTNNRWGQLSTPTLSTVLQQAAKGDIADWADLCEFMIDTDELMTSLYTTRLTRVSQADYVVAPNEHGNPKLAELAAEFVNEQLGRIGNWQKARKEMLHAIAPGFSASQMHWLRDDARRLWYVSNIEHVHGHRFRYGMAWDLRLYDRGMRQGADGYGEVLKPGKWIIHTHQEQAGYPGIAGVMRACAYAWLFRRWVREWEVGHLETHGSPLLYGKVPHKTPDAVREQIIADLERLSTDQVGVMEGDVELIVDASAAAAKSYEAFQAFAIRSKEAITAAWLGIEDAVGPGASGSQAAVSVRAGVAMDPRMVSDGDGLATTLQGSLFKWLIHYNAHLLGAPADEVPIPTFRLKTADDEVVRDRSDKIEELEDEAAAEGESIEVQDEVAEEVKAPTPAIPSEPVGMSDTDVDRVATRLRTLLAEPPKALPRKGPPNTPESAPRTLQTTDASQSAIAKALRGELAGQGS